MPHPKGLQGGVKRVSRFPLKDTYCNLGWTLLATDVNGDSEPDLVIGSPFAPGGGKQKGMVAAFYSGPGRSNQGSACWGRSGTRRAPVRGDLCPFFLFPNPFTYVFSQSCILAHSWQVIWIDSLNIQKRTQLLGQMHRGPASPSVKAETLKGSQCCSEVSKRGSL